MSYLNAKAEDGLPLHHNIYRSLVADQAEGNRRVAFATPSGIYTVRLPQRKAELMRQAHFIAHAATLRRMPAQA